MVLFAMFLFGPFFGNFNGLETQIYQNALIEGMQTKLENVSSGFDGWLADYDQKIIDFNSSESVKESILTVQSQNAIAERADLAGSLIFQNPGILGIRILDADGIRVHYSTFLTDRLSSNEDKTSFRNYVTLEKTPSLLQFQGVGAGNVKKTVHYFDVENNLIIFVQALYDTYDVFRGYTIMYLTVSDFQRRLVASSVISVTQNLTLAGKSGSMKNAGFILDVPQNAGSSLLDWIADIWKQQVNAEMVFSDNGTDYIAVNYVSPGGISVTQLEDESVFTLPGTVEIILLAAVFISVFLIIFMLLNLRKDDYVIIRERVKRFQMAFITEFINQRENGDWQQLVENIASRKNDVVFELKHSIGARRIKRHEAEIDEMLDRSWLDLMTALGIQVNQMVGINLFANASFQNALGARPSKPAQVPVNDSIPSFVEPIVALEEIGEGESADNIPEAEFVSELEDDEKQKKAETAVVSEDSKASKKEEVLEELEEVEELEGVDETEDLTETETPAEADGAETSAHSEKEDSEDVEELGELEEVEELEELEEVDETEELTDPEPVEKTVPASSGNVEEAGEREQTEAEALDALAESLVIGDRVPSEDNTVSPDFLQDFSSEFPDFTDLDMSPESLEGKIEITIPVARNQPLLFDAEPDYSKLDSDW